VSNKTKGCLMLLLVPVVFVAAVPLYGWAMQTLWGWFVVPLGVRPLTIVQAWGICSLVWFAAYHKTQTKEPKPEWWEPIAELLLRPPLAVATGWFVQWCAR
jgi:hypothetical protein